MKKKSTYIRYPDHLVENLISAANLVIDSWEAGDLAGAVNELQLALEEMDARYELEQEEYCAYPEL